MKVSRPVKELIEGIREVAEKIDQLNHEIAETEEELREIRNEIADLLPPGCYIREINGNLYVYKSVRKTPHKVVGVYQGAVLPKRGRPAPDWMIELCEEKRRRIYSELEKLRERRDETEKRLRKLKKQRESLLKRLRAKQKNLLDFLTFPTFPSLSEE